MLKKLAQEIAKTTSEVINHDVLITDRNGLVLGSSDLTRIGTLHQASLGTIFSRKERTHNEMISRTMIGVKPGMTIPIELSGELIGTIGITGNPNEVKKYGMLAKKYAEILLREEIMNKSVLLREKALQSLVQEIASFDSNYNDEMLLLARGRELGFDLKLPRAVFVIDLFQFNHFTSEIYDDFLVKDSPEIYIQSLKLNIESKIKEIFSDSQDITVSLESDKYIVFHAIRDDMTKQEISERNKIKCKRLIDLIKDLGVKVSIGIGTIGKDLIALNKGYHSAWRALRIGKEISDSPSIFDINDFILEELFSYIHKDIAHNFIEEELMKLKQVSNHEELFRTIIVWCESEFSPIKSSENLSIHRNTLFYRINKIEDLTGKNLRKFKDSLELYIAIKLMNLYY